MKVKKVLVCCPDCQEPVLCDVCGKPIYEEEPFYCLMANILEASDQNTIGRVHAHAAVINRHLHCGVEDIYRKLRIEDPELEIALSYPGASSDIN